ncbi:hypothetical protein [Actinomadura madurae]|uniref:hypothetical protein n=1 Tax=Actinomadura madurae TaxID=1993 RepID=UPI0020D2166A|nr:hypothetical protein [Actinomadura madurae]MCP9968720.1 hypothetical protein [Actinomadura madurae]MCQ0007306.1 hypothetical protein [Actinomadura madurae]
MTAPSSSERMVEPVKRVLTVVMGCSLLVAGSAATASATASVDNVSIYTTDGRSGGGLGFSPHGDVITVCDVQSDGKRAVGYVRNPDGTRRYKLFDRKNDGKCTTHRASEGQPYNLNENKTYRFEICLDDDPGPDQFCNHEYIKAGG